MVSPVLQLIESQTKLAALQAQVDALTEDGLYGFREELNALTTKVGMLAFEVFSLKEEDRGQYNKDIDSFNTSMEILGEQWNLRCQEMTTRLSEEVTKVAFSIPTSIDEKIKGIYEDFRKRLNALQKVTSSDEIAMIRDLLNRSEPRDFSALLENPSRSSSSSSSSSSASSSSTQVPIDMSDEELASRLAAEEYGDTSQAFSADPEDVENFDPELFVKGLDFLKALNDGDYRLASALAIPPSSEDPLALALRMSSSSSSNNSSSSSSSNSSSSRPSSSSGSFSSSSSSSSKES